MKKTNIYRKKHDKLLLLLVVLTISMWSYGIFLWLGNRDVSPPPTSLTTQSFEIDINVVQKPVDFNFENAHTIFSSSVDFNSQHALLINLDTNEVVFEHRARERAFPASVTKIMTVLVGLEHATEELIPVEADFNMLYLAQASMTGFASGEIRTLSEVLHGSLLSSGADATSTLAHHVAGSYEAFVSLMNETAGRLGMYDTNFMNASGLHHELHYTTAYDIGLLMAYVLNIPFLRELLSTPTYPFINSEGQNALMQSILFRGLPDVYFDGGFIQGGKTGFTTPAGFCLASFATNGINQYTLITFGAPSGYPIGGHIQDALNIYSYFLR